MLFPHTRIKRELDRFQKLQGLKIAVKRIDENVEFFRYHCRRNTKTDRRFREEPTLANPLEVPCVWIVAPVGMKGGRFDRFEVNVAWYFHANRDEIRRRIDRIKVHEILK